MAKSPASVENSNIGTDPSQLYGWDTAPVRIGASGDAIKTAQVDDNGVVVNPATQETLSQVQQAIQEAVQLLTGLAATRGIAADFRVTLLSGTLTTVSTVTTVTTVTGLTNIGGFAAIQAIPAIQNNIVTLANIQNVAVN